MQRTIALADGSITSPFLEMFGRPSRDTGLESERNNEPTDAQRLYLLNSTDVQQRIERSPLAAAARRTGRGSSPLSVIRPVYLAVLSRDPTQAELSAASAYLSAAGRGPARGRARPGVGADQHQGVPVPPLVPPVTQRRKPCEAARSETP